MLVLNLSPPHQGIPHLPFLLGSIPSIPAQNQPPTGLDSSNSASEVNFGGVRPYLGLLHNVYICDVDEDVGHGDYGDIDSIGGGVCGVLLGTSTST